MIPPQAPFCRKLLVLVLLITSALPSPLLADSHEENWVKLFSGIEYQVTTFNKFNKAIIHIARIDLNNHDITFFVTPPQKNNKNYLLSQTTSDFLKKYKLQLAINAQAFGPPLPMIPGLPKKVCGFATSKGTEYGRRGKEESMFVIFKNGSPDIIKLENYNALKNEIYMAISGWTHRHHSDLLVYDDSINDYYIQNNSAGSRCGRTAIGISRDKDFVFLVVVEQKNGLKLAELAKFMKKIGSFKAINLDGGRSSTIVIQSNTDTPTVVNALLNDFERPVANHLGIYAIPL